MSTWNYGLEFGQPMMTPEQIAEAVLVETPDGLAFDLTAALILAAQKGIQAAVTDGSCDQCGDKNRENAK